jgi:DGQHR domain-containing protein
MTNKKYFGCLVRQREAIETVSFFVFYAFARDVKQWAGIRRVKDFSDGTQRILRPARQKAIKNFLERKSINTIPNNILLAFSPDASEFIPLEDKLADCLEDSSADFDFHNGCENRIQWGTLQFSFDPAAQEYEKPALIVDGQHRLYGMSSFENEDVPILVVSLIDASLQEQAFQFVVINNKAVRVPTDNVRAILANLDEQELENRLLSSGVKYADKSPVLRDINDLDYSPFKDLLNWPYNTRGNKLVPLTSIEQSLRYLQSVFNIDEDDDSLVGLFCSIWRAIALRYDVLWGQENQLMKKVSLNALNEFVTDRLKFAWEMGLIDIFDSDAVERQVSNIVAMLPQEFWQGKWSIRVQDNSNVRNLIKSDLETLTNNSRLRKNWRDDLKLPHKSAEVSESED